MRDNEAESAAMGSRCQARTAGYMPRINPTETEKANPSAAAG